MNSVGERIVVGANDQGEIVGLSNRNPIGQVEDHLRKKVMPPAMWTVTLEETDDGKLLVVDAPKGMRARFGIEMEQPLDPPLQMMFPRLLLIVSKLMNDGSGDQH